MKMALCLVVFLFILTSTISAQLVSPVPMVESEMRDASSAKRRAIELDRVKREANRLPSENLGPAGVNHFLEIKADFENIQTSEAGIVKIYTTQKQIDFAQVAALSFEINKSALRLKDYIFAPPKNEKNQPVQNAENKEKSSFVARDLPQLIVDLDNAIAAFVGNPIFVSSKKVRPKERETAQTELEKIIDLSEALRSEAQTRAVPKN